MNRPMILAILVCVGLGASAQARDVEDAPPVAAMRQELDSETMAALSALRAAKRAGDREAVQRIGQQLGWISPAPAAAGGTGESSSRFIVREDRISSDKRFGDDVLLSTLDFDYGNPAMAIRSDGMHYAVAEDLQDTFLDIYRSFDHGATWSYWTSINTLEDPTHPSVAIGEGEANRLLIAYVVGSSTASSAVEVAYIDFDTEDFGIAPVATNPGLPIGPPSICVDYPEYSFWYAYLVYAPGVLFKQLNSSTLDFSVSFTAGAGWSEPVTIVSQVSGDDEPDIDFGQDYLHVACTETLEDGLRDILVLRNDDFGFPPAWSQPLPLAISDLDESEPRIAATNGGDAVVMAYRKDFTGEDSDIQAFCSQDAGATWSQASFPWTFDDEVRVDLAVSQEFGQIHAAFLRGADVMYTSADNSDPSSWSEALVINELNAAVFGVRPAVAVDPTQFVEERVAWADQRAGALDPRIYFDAGTWQVAEIYPDGTGDFATIQDAIDDAVGEVLILLADGVYTGPGNIDIDPLGKPIELRSASGDPELCIIDCQGTPDEPHRAFYIHSGEGPATVIADIQIINGYAGARANKAETDGNGGGMLIENGSSPTIEGVIFRNNSAETGGGGLHVTGAPAALLDPSYPLLDGLVFRGNASQSGGGGLHISEGSAPALFRSTFVENSGPLAGGIYLELGSFVLVEQTIIAFSLQGPAVACDGTSSVSITCCDVYGNAGGDWVDCIAEAFDPPINFSLDPHFCDLAGGDLTLRVDSPCLPENNFCGQLIGALGAGCGDITAIEAESMPARIELAQNSPNPFNPFTEIRFALPQDLNVKLKIYSVTGRQVATLVDRELAAGVHAITWNGRDDRGRLQSSGTYFYRLDAGSFSTTRRMLLLK